MRYVHLILLFIGLNAARNGFADCGQKFDRTYHSLHSTLSRYHFYASSGIDHQVAKFFPSECLDALDPRRLIFTETEAEKIRKQAAELLNNGDPCTFYTSLRQMYFQARDRCERWVETFGAAPFNFNTNESYQHTYLEKKNFCASEQELEERWRKEVKFRTLINMVQMGDTAFLRGEQPKSLTERESDGRQRAVKKLQCRLGPKLNDQTELDAYLTEEVLNAYAQSWDPHSNYFSKQSLDIFNAQLSSEELSFGLSFEKNRQEDLVVAKVVPGGPAWRSNQLHEGDKVLAIRTSNGDLLSDPCVEPEEILSKLTFSTKSTISMDVRKRNGSSETVKLTNARMEVEDNIVKSFILEDDMKVGYIALPGFYSEWNGSGVIGCASDVAREVIQLKRSGISGLILDLRYNGGGSVEEALELIGIFIDEGPLCFAVDGGEPPYLMKDPNRGLVYDGPLIVMINELSASAAELTAAILQEYNRAVVVGSRSYGKASGQIVLPLDPAFNPELPVEKAIDSTYGFVKLTTGLFYILSDQTYQGKGVVPDLSLPELYRKFISDEASYPQVLQPLTIEKKVNYTLLPDLPKEELKRRYAARASNAELLRALQADVNYLHEWYYASKDYPLNFEAFEKMDHELSDRLHHFSERLEFKSNNWQVKHHAMDESILMFDEERKKIDERTQTQISQDLYLYESCRIMSDLKSLYHP